MSKRLSVRTPKLAALTPLPSSLPPIPSEARCRRSRRSRRRVRAYVCITSLLQTANRNPPPIRRPRTQTDGPYGHRFAGYLCLIQNHFVLRAFPLRAERHTRNPRCRVRDELQSSGRNSNRFPSRCKSHSEKNSRIFSRLTGRRSPRSVTNPSISSAGVTSKAGL